MKVRILRPNFHTQCWYDNLIGQEFEVIDIHHGIPDQYEVDVTALMERGELTVDRAYIPFCDAEVEDIPTNLPYPKPTVKCHACGQNVATRPWLTNPIKLDAIEQHMTHTARDEYCPGSNRSARPAESVATN